MKIDFQGNVPGLQALVNKAGFKIHSAVHVARPDAKCVMHCHTVAGVAVGAHEIGLLPLSGHAMMVHGDIGYHDYEGVVLDQDEIPRLLGSLGGYHSLMLRNHGTLTVGRSVAEAFMRMYYLERACEMQVATLSLGPNPIMIPSNVLDHAQGQMAINYGDLAALAWSAMLRLQDRRDPGFRE